MISINEAVSKKIERLRKLIWAMPEDHLKIDVIDGKLGPWIHVYSPFNKSCNGRDPVSLLWINFDRDEIIWVPYTGPLPTSHEYKEKEKSFETYKYPEHEKLDKIKDESQLQSSFLEWLMEHYTICDYKREPCDDNYHFFPIHRTVNSLLAEYHDVDEGKLEQEKQQMLDQLRNQNPEETPQRYSYTESQTTVQQLSKAFPGWEPPTK